MSTIVSNEKNTLTRWWLGACVLGLIVWILYGRSLHYAYVWDDVSIFLEKNDLVADQLSWSLLAQPVIEGTSYFRPLVFLTWFIEFHAFGQDPMISHAINVLLFMVNVLLLYSLAKSIFFRIGLENSMLRAFIAASFYSIHPALIENVAWVSARFDLLCTTFSLLVLLATVRMSSSWLRVLIVSLSTLLACLSKEAGVLMPLLTLCIAMTLESKFTPLKQRIILVWRTNKFILLGQFFAIVIYLTLRSFSVEVFYHAPFNLQYLQNAILIKMLPIEALREYFILAIFPFAKISVVSPLDDLNLGSLSRLPLNVVSLLVLFWIFLNAFKRNSFWAWMCLGFLGSLALVLHIIPLISNYLVQNRFLAIPLVFLSLAFASISVEKIKRNFGSISLKSIRLGISLIGGMWVLFSVITILTVLPMWRNDLSLWAWSYSQYPNFKSVQQNYLNAAFEYGRNDLVKKEIKSSFSKNGRLDASDQVMYAYLLMREGDPESLKYLEGVISILPKFHQLNDGKHLMKSFEFSSGMIGSIYLNYAKAKIYFDNDLNLARENNSVADWYYHEGQKGAVVLQRAVIEYLGGDYTAASVDMNALRNIYFSGKADQIAEAKSLMNHYCDRWSDESLSNSVCARLKEDLKNNSIFDNSHPL